MKTIKQTSLYIAFRKWKLDRRQRKFFNKSYSQSGEDLIINHLFASLKIKRPTYLDIGAHHPFYLSNTAYFYKKGSKGVLVEPDPELFKVIKKYRKNDICLNIGIGIDDKKDADFYVMTASALNTFSKSEAQERDKNSPYKIKKILKLPLKNINNIIDLYMDKTPDFINIDTEGLDFEIIKSLDLKKYRPKVICIETIGFISQEKIHNIPDYLLNNGYLNYADTHINTIFIDESLRE